MQQMQKFMAIQSYFKKQEKQNRQPNITLKTTGKRRTKKPQNQQKERNHKDLSRTNEKEMKETIVKINN